MLRAHQISKIYSWSKDAFLFRVSRHHLVMFFVCFYVNNLIYCLKANSMFMRFVFVASWISLILMAIKHDAESLNVRLKLEFSNLSKNYFP